MSVLVETGWKWWTYYMITFVVVYNTLRTILCCKSNSTLNFLAIRSYIICLTGICQKQSKINKSESLKCTYIKNQSCYVLFDTKKNPQHNIHEHESCKVLINFIYTLDTSIIKQKSVTEDWQDLVHQRNCTNKYIYLPCYDTSLH
jgi:hypothetical protein